MSGSNVQGVFNADMGARTLAWRIREQKPFFFVRIGDGAIECIRGSGRAGHTCDGEEYNRALAGKLAASISTLRAGGDTVIWGDWRTATAGSAPTYTDEWAKMVDAPNRLRIDYESLLLMRESAALVEFYKSVRNDSRSKLYIGRDALAAGDLLRCKSVFLTPMGMGWREHYHMLKALSAIRPKVVLFGAGMVGLTAVVDYWQGHADVTCIHLGSALDPLYQPRATRAGQLSKEQATNLMEAIL